MLRRRTCLLTLCMGVGRLCGQTAPLGVDHFIDQAFQRNREILAARERVEEARGLLRQAGVRPAPAVEVNGASGRPLGSEGEHNFSVGYYQPIELGGKRSKRLAVAEAGLELAQAELAERQRQLAFDIKSRFIETIASRRKVEAIDRIAGINREAYRLVDARVQRDDAAPLERQLLLVELNRTEAQRATAGGQLGAAELELQLAVAVPATAPLPTLAPTAPLADTAPSAEELQRRALDLRPDLRAMRVLATQSAAETELAAAQGRPDLTLSAQYARQYSQFEDPLRITAAGAPLPLQDNDNILSFGISIPLQKRKRNLGNIEAAAARQAAARLRREHLELTIPLEVEAAWRRYEAARNTVTLLNRGVLDQSEQNLSVIRQAYNLGQLRLLDVLNEQRRLLELQLSFIDAEAELARSFAELERAVGGELK